MLYIKGKVDNNGDNLHHVKDKVGDKLLYVKDKIDDNNDILLYIKCTEFDAC